MAYIVDLYISEYVVDEVCRSIGSFGSHHSYATYERAVHRSLDKSKVMLDTASILGLYGIVLLLSIGQRIVAMPLLTDDGIHSFLSDDVILGFVTGIKE